MVNFESAQSVAHLDQYLADRSYVEGYQPSQADVVVFKALKGAPDAGKYKYASRWYSHIQAFTEEERSKFREASVPTAAEAPAKAAAKSEDDFDLFEEEDAEADAAHEAELEKKRKEAEAAKGSKKKDVIAKSSLLLDVKPWDDETPMDKLEEAVRSINLEGLTWGASKLVPVGYGIKKLQINAVVIDDLVSVDDLEEKITSFEDFVQSMDIAAFNKI